MKEILVIFWAVLIFASIAWYAFLVFYIGLKGGKEIRQMTKTLREKHQNLPIDK